MTERVSMRKIEVQKNNKLLENAKKLRRDMTPQEKHLWYDFLKNYPIKIYKQRIIDNFIVDFYCHKARLVIEIDGAQHYTPEGKSYDNERAKIIEQYNLHILRFSNNDIDTKFDSVCRMIDKEIKKKVYNQSL